MMPILVQCPNPACLTTSPANENISGRTVRCKKCGQSFVAKATIDGEKTDTKKSQPAVNAEPFTSYPAEFGRYRILRLLGRGGMGAVYLAEDTQLGREVALKIPFFDPKDTPRLQRFSREARSAAGLHHPNICTVFDAGQIDGKPFITMAYITGKPLEDLIDPAKPMSELQAAEIIRKVALALEYAHSKSIIHRDLKPANIMMSKAGEPIVMDFGLAKRVLEDDVHETKLTKEGGILGTPTYMSPEQVKGEQSKIGPPSDIYTLGVILFEMLAGRPPYTGGYGAVMGQILGAPIPPIKEIRPDIDGRIEALLNRAMAKDPSIRIPSMGVFATSLGQIIEGLTQEANQVPSALAVPESIPMTDQAVPNASTASWAISQSSKSQRDKTQQPFENLDTDDDDFNVTELPDVREKPGNRSKSVKAKRSIEKLIGVAVAALFIFSVGLGAVILKFSTSNGTLVVEINDNDVEAKFKGGKLVLTGPDGKERYLLSPSERNQKLDTGEYKIRVEGVDGLTLDTTEFTLKKGDKVTVRVTMEKKEIAAAGPTKEEAKRIAPRPGEERAIDLGRGVKMIFCYIPKGECKLGTPMAERTRVIQELTNQKFFNIEGGKEWIAGEAEEVRGRFITNGFWMSKYEVTQEQWTSLMGSNPSYFNGKNENYAQDFDTAQFPVEVVNFSESQKCVAKLDQLENSKKTFGKTAKFSLPDEDQWEYAYRGGLGNLQAFHWGNNLNRDFANVIGSFPANSISTRVQSNRTVKVGNYEKIAPHPWGLCDMTGNVWEICLSKSPDAKNGIVFRGGSFSTVPVHLCRPQHRLFLDKDYRAGDTGFRVMLTTDEPGLKDQSDTPANSPDSGKLAADPDRKAAEYVLSIGGIIRVNNEIELTKKLEDLPKLPFRLTHVNLNANGQLKNNDLEVFQGCIHLKTLEIAGTNVRDSGLEYFAKCTELRELDLAGTKISDEGLAHFKACVKLEKLLLTFVPITDNGLASLKNCTQLKFIGLYSVPVTGEGFEEFKDLSAMEELHVLFSRFTDKALTYFKNSKKLTLIALGGTQVTDKGMENLKECKELRSLDLFRTTVSDVGFENFKNCTKLTSVTVASTQMTDKGLAHFKNCTNLSDFTLRGTKVTKEGLADFRLALPKCQIDIKPDQEINPANVEPPQIVPKDAAFVSLFNGKDLTGWKSINGGEPDWTVRDGYIEVSPGKQHLKTIENFGPDFQFSAEFWLPLMAASKGQARANSGIYLQGRHEIQILDIFGNEADSTSTMGAMYGLIAPDADSLKQAVKKPETWNTLDITFQSPRTEGGLVKVPGKLSVVLNGIKIVDNATFDKITGQSIDNNIGMPGPIVLQNHRDNLVRFRNLKIKDLSQAPKEANPPKKNNPPKVEGKVVPKDFLDPNDWIGAADIWRIEGGSLIAETKGDLKHNSCYYSKQKYTDFELSYKLQIKNGVGNSGVQIRSELADAILFKVKGPQVDAGQNYWGSLYGEGIGGMMKAADPVKMKKAVKEAEFNQCTIVVKGKRVTVKINGETLVDDSFPTMSKDGIIAFQAHGGYPGGMRLEFKDIVFKDLSKKP